MHDQSQCETLQPLEEVIRPLCRAIEPEHLAVGYLGQPAQETSQTTSSLATERHPLEEAYMMLRLVSALADSMATPVCRRDNREGPDQMFIGFMQSMVHGLKTRVCCLPYTACPNVLQPAQGSLVTRLPIAPACCLLKVWSSACSQQANSMLWRVRSSRACFLAWQVICLSSKRMRQHCMLSCTACDTTCSAIWA